MPNMIHIVFGDSAKGTLRYFLQSNDTEIKGEIIGLRDDFSVGPILDINSEAGLKKRLEWLKNVYAHVEGGEYLPHLEEAYLKESDTIHNIAAKSQVIIWHGENSCDQVGLRYLSFLLSNQEIFEVNVSDLRLTATNGIKYQPRSLAECSPEQIRLLLPGITKMSPDRVRQLSEEFENLRVSPEKLRILIDHEIIAVDESYYDDALLSNCSFDFQKAARVIGATMGSVDQFVSDTYLEYRVRQLIDNDKLSYKGKLLAMRDYEICK